MNKEDFLKLELKNISQVYSGKQNCCRCGCGGNYVSTSFMKEPRSEVNDKLALQRLKRAKKLVEAGAEIDFGGNYADITTGENRTLTFYFDDLKED